MKEACPRVEAISAFIDGALGAPARQELARHAKDCPLCAATLRNFMSLSQDLQGLRDTRCEIDLAALVDRRLADRAPPRRPADRRARWQGWPLVPQGLGAAGVLALGIYLGQVLAGGAASVRPAAMAVFDVSPPGGLCAGRCYREGR